MFWIRESTLRAKFRIYERWPALFPHALDIDEQYEELPEDAAEIEFLELHFEEHKAAENLNRGELLSFPHTIRKRGAIF